MIEGSTSEDEWITHQLAGHTHREEVLLWDDELGMDWPAELRCADCEAVRYLNRGEAAAKAAAATRVKEVKHGWRIRESQPLSKSL